MTHIRVTENNSSYAEADSHSGCMIDHSTSTNVSATSRLILDVTDTATHKVAFSTQVSDSSITTSGNSSELGTCMWFVKLADT